MSNWSHSIDDVQSVNRRLSDIFARINYSSFDQNSSPGELPEVALCRLQATLYSNKIVGQVARLYRLHGLI